jgi:F-type H+-transporting ATPase subunit delta
MADAITIVRPYAVAAFRLAKEQNALSRWSEMLSFVSAIASDAQMKAIIENPKVVASDLERLFLSVCEKKLDKAGENMIKLLVEYGRLALLPEVAEAFEDLKAQDEGMLEAEITAAAQPSESEIQALVRRLETKFGKKIEASIKVDPEIIGGIKIVIGDTVIDASVRGQLQEMAYALKA